MCPGFCLDIPTIVDRLDAAHLAWRDYAGLLADIKPLAGRTEITFDDDGSLFRDAADGTPPRYGFRVPCLIVSPYARAGYISHQPHSLASILRFIEILFNLEPLTERDARQRHARLFRFYTRTA